MSKQQTTIRRGIPGGRLSRIGAAIAGTILATGAIAIAGTGVANATAVPVDPSGYLVGNTVYFTAPNLGNCAMQSNGWVGCDLAQTENWAGFQVSNIGIDLGFLPAHPAIGPIGTHGQAGSRQLVPPAPAPGQAYGPDASISYGGATCTVSGFRAEVSCNSQGHSFSFGFTEGYN
ncbi:hypothetical protein KO481_05160 [Nocardia sp. NEAU-G5]|uniref:Secreted protein n=1 Tax=Nocardia albiluteola TaxID=2842303 RepID=A0ABS6ASB1_9NOCA|nr:hypothetical protein [Nocardia albiluteola]MBU3060912.1 hypothetical protein [Nocardia albiluteola]